MPKDLEGVVSLDLTRSPKIPADHLTIQAAAQQLLVIDESSFQIAASLIQSSASRIKSVEDFFEEDKSLAFRLHKSICEKISTITAPWRSVRPLLEPRMKQYRAEQDRIRREEEQRVAREAELARIAAEKEASRIREEAEQKALGLKNIGEMRQAREVSAAAQQQAAAVVEQADELADLGTIEAAPAKVAGVSDSRPWVGEVTDIKALCLAIGTGKVPLEWLTPVRGQGEIMTPLVTVNQSVLNNIAKRMGKADLGIAGVRGVREVQLRFSKSEPVPTNQGEW